MTYIHYIIFLLVLCILACNENKQSIYIQWYDNELDTQKYHKELDTQNIKHQDSNVLFIFFTDTHISDNMGHSLKIIKSIQHTTNCPSVFWGGDAITAYSTNMEEEWESQKKILDSISLNSNVYAIRGNHDFTYKKRNTGIGKTLTQKEVSKRIKNCCTSNIVSDNTNDSACYYFVDDISNQIRYIVFDTDDQGEYGDVPWGYKSSINHNQLNWIARNAILSTPGKYGIIFLSHIPITHNYNSAFSKTEKVLIAAAKKEVITMDVDTYDFTKMNDGTRILAILSGHNHHDMQVFAGGLLQIITASDAFYSNYQRSPLWEYYPKREKNTEREQVVELCKYNKDENILLFFRFGYGGNRFYHLTPITTSIGDTLKLPVTNSATIFGAYDSDAKYNSNSKVWSLNHNIVYINEHGVVSANNIGETTVYAINKDGDTEFFDIIVK